MKKKLWIIITFLILGLMYSINVEATQRLKILFISSHNPNHESFNDQIQGIKDGLAREVQLQIEYLDFKTFESTENENNFYNLLKYKVNNYKKFDAIILGDDEALRFGIKYKDELFKDMPIVFLAVNEVELADEAVAKGLTGVVEKESIEDNIELINTLHPNAKNIILVKDEAFGNTRDIDKFYSLAPKYENLNFSHISLEDNSFDELAEKLSELGKDDIIITLYPHFDKNGENISQKEAIKFIDNSTEAPIYGVSYYGIDNGIVGGKLINQYELAKRVGEIANDIIEGKDTSKSYINDDSLNRYVFDYNKLMEYGIKEDRLPVGSEIVNKPIPLIKKYKELVLPAVSILTVLIGIIIVLIIYLVNKRRYEKELLKAKELAEEANRAKGNFISNISHELRTPISVIMSSNQLQKLKIDKLDEIKDVSEINSKDFSQSVKTITQNCYRLLRLVNNIIDVAKFDSGYTHLDLRNINIVELIENISLSVIPYAKIKGIEVIFDTTEEEVIMAVDAEKIERIILNLLSNAIKFSRENGEIKIDLNFSNDKAIITVEDNGIGIKKEYLTNIFERFVQVDKTLTRHNEGSGIGLSIVKSFVELHNGEISVESIENEGSKFIIKLPITIVKEAIDSSKDDKNQEGNVINTKIEFSDIYF